MNLVQLPGVPVAAAGSMPVLFAKVTSVVLTTRRSLVLDIPDTFEEIKLCVAYKYQGQILNEMPASLKVLGAVGAGI